MVTRNVYYFIFLPNHKIIPDLWVVVLQEKAEQVVDLSIRACVLWNVFGSKGKENVELVSSREVEKQKFLENLKLKHLEHSKYCLGKVMESVWRYGCYIPL